LQDQIHDFEIELEEERERHEDASHHHRGARLRDECCAHTTATLPNPPGTGWQLPARLSRVRLVLRAVAGRTGRCDQAAEWHLSVGLASDFLPRRPPPHPCNSHFF